MARLTLPSRLELKRLEGSAIRVFDVELRPRRCGRPAVEGPARQHRPGSEPTPRGTNGDDLAMCRGVEVGAYPVMASAPWSRSSNPSLDRRTLALSSRDEPTRASGLFDSGFAAHRYPRYGG